MIFRCNWPLTLDQITKLKLKLNICFVFFSKKSPISARLIVEIHFLKMLKANLLQDRNNRKNSVKCEHSIVDLGDVGLTDPNHACLFIALWGLFVEKINYDLFTEKTNSWIKLRHSKSNKTLF